jgi:hypothetical protein
MALSAKQRQKKLERKNKKRKQHRKYPGASRLLRDKAENYTRFPIHECLVPDGLFETGLGNVIVTRQTQQGTIAISAFVVDVYCLGVKNALFKVSNEYDYEHTIKPRLIQSHEGQYFESLHQACAKKLIEGAIHYAEELGFSPHRDYHNAKNIFGDIDASVCPVKYTYGKDGKPFYIRGPNESSNQASKIIDQLHTRCGEGNYNYLVTLDEDIFE